jgi:hypothetical protein
MYLSHHSFEKQENSRLDSRFYHTQSRLEQPDIPESQELLAVKV